jgi:hypothetical protein
MVRHHVLIGLGFKRKNFRNRALKYLMDRKIIGSGMRPAIWSDNETMRPAVMPYSRPTKGSGHMTMRPAVEPPSNSRQRAPLKFNY